MRLCWMIVVVSLRQLERQLDREKEKSSTELTAAHAVHQDEVEKLSRQLQILQSDNNLLLVNGPHVYHLPSEYILKLF